MTTNTTPQQPRRGRKRFDTNGLKRTVVISGVLATLVGGEMIAGQELFGATSEVSLPPVVSVARLPIDHDAWAVAQTPINQLVVPEAVTSDLPIVDGQLLVDGNPIIELVVPEIDTISSTAVDTSGLVGEAPIIELVVPNPVVIPASSAGSIDIGNNPLVSLSVPQNTGNNGGGAANVPAPTTTSKSSK